MRNKKLSLEANNGLRFFSLKETGSFYTNFNKIRDYQKTIENGQNNFHFFYKKEKPYMYNLDNLIKSHHFYMVFCS